MISINGRGLHFKARGNLYALNSSPIPKQDEVHGMMRPAVSRVASMASGYVGESLLAASTNSINLNFSAFFHPFEGYLLVKDIWKQIPKQMAN